MTDRWKLNQKCKFYCFIHFAGNTTFAESRVAQNVAHPKQQCCMTNTKMMVALKRWWLLVDINFILQQATRTKQNPLFSKKNVICVCNLSVFRWRNQLGSIKFLNCAPFWSQSLTHESEQDSQGSSFCSFSEPAI